MLERDIYQHESQWGVDESKIESPDKFQVGVSSTPRIIKLVSMNELLPVESVPDQKYYLINEF